MTEREELVKRLQRLAMQIGGNGAVDICDAIAALTAAQPDGKCIAPPCKCNDSNRGVCAYWHPIDAAIDASIAGKGE
jgi:hypothetical protein